ncbi:U-box domain-containing protein 52 [Tetrabaena socialis]|uniref:U-box domain-containing protein 52 n=1 Tax=Tetrabaena socialis TaxID=47790 RepID=A0A2J8AJP0_9CHLO|nr:U-box domain-containing protein 52 [Tetrabaena socialis]|eukprot:PNH12734.1 U-box domain-containing protein 52 [Tetrabaena socialis]
MARRDANKRDGAVVARQVVSIVEAARQQPLGFGPCIDPRAGSWPAAEAVAFADLGLRCVEYRRQDRPDLRTVILPTLMQLKQRTLLYEQTEERPQPQQPVPGGGVPPMFLCPITQDVMDEPVVAADGYTYERLAIQEWVARSRTSPLTNMPLAHAQLVDNLTLRSAIKEWREQAAQQQRRPQRDAGAGAGW